MEDGLDQALERVFQASFSLTEEEEETLWQDFVKRTPQEEQVWRAFTAVMLQASARLRQAVEWSRWPARGLPGVT